MPPTTAFNFFLNKRPTLLIISWNGELTVNDVDELQRCSVEVRGTPQKFIVLNLHGFTGYDAVLAGNIVSFQSMLRARATYMLLAGLEPQVRERMLEKGLINQSDVADTLKDALQKMLIICPT